mgnify:CR=1 FL=1
MEMFLYMDKDSILHKLDPRTKIFIMLISFAIALMFSSLSLLLILSFLVILYGALGKVLSNLKRIRVILIMIAIMSVILWALTYPGTTRLWGPVTKEGIIYGIAIGIKFDVMIIAGMIFLSSTKIEEISLGLVKLGIPYRPAFAFSTAVRLVPMIVSTSYIITQAQKSRGLDLDTGNILQRIRKYIPLLIPVLISVIRQANILAMALESKGFGYSDKRTSYLEIKFEVRDYVFLAVAMLILIGAVYFKFKYKL